MDRKLPKKVFILLLAGFLLVSFGTFAQDTTEGVYDDPLRFGFKIGGTSSSFAVDHNDFSDKIHGLVVGGVVSYKFTDWFRLQGDLLYQQQGAANLNSVSFGIGTISPSDPSLILISPVNTYSNIKLHNVEIAATGQFSPPKFDGGAFEPFLSVGFAYGYNINARAYNKTSYTADDGTEYKSTSYNEVNNLIQVNDLGAIIGLGLNMNAEKLMYTLEVRYRNGLSNISNTSSTNPLDYITTNVTVVALNVMF